MSKPAATSTLSTKGERQAQAIVDAVRELVAEKPISELKISEITTRAAIARPVFYFYFDTKYSPLAVALSEAVRDLDDALQPLLEPDPRDSLEDHLLHFLTVAAAKNIQHLDVVRAALDARKLDPALGTLVQELLDLLVDRATTLIESEIAAGRAIPATDNVPATVRTLVVMTVLAGQNMDLVGTDTQSAITTVIKIARNSLWATPPTT